MWVRTRGLKTKESQCKSSFLIKEKKKFKLKNTQTFFFQKGHFSERPLPSAGLFSFLRAYLCQLNNQCFKTARSSYSNDKLFKLLEISNEFLSITNKSNVYKTLKESVQLTNLFAVEREKATKLTSLTRILITFYLTYLN